MAGSSARSGNAKGQPKAPGTQQFKKTYTDNPNFTSAKGRDARARKTAMPSEDKLRPNSEPSNLSDYFGGAARSHGERAEQPDAPTEQPETPVDKPSRISPPNLRQASRTNKAEINFHGLSGVRQEAGRNRSSVNFNALPKVQQVAAENRSEVHGTPHPIKPWAAGAAPERSLPSLAARTLDVSGDGPRASGIKVGRAASPGPARVPAALPSLAARTVDVSGAGPRVGGIKVGRAAQVPVTAPRAAEPTPATPHVAEAEARRTPPAPPTLPPNERTTPRPSTSPRAGKAARQQARWGTMDQYNEMKAARRRDRQERGLHIGNAIGAVAARVFNTRPEPIGRHSQAVVNSRTGVNRIHPADSMGPAEYQGMFNSHPNQGAYMAEVQRNPQLLARHESLMSAARNTPGATRAAWSPWGANAAGSSRARSPLTLPSGNGTGLSPHERVAAFTAKHQLGADAADQDK